MPLNPSSCILGHPKQILNKIIRETEDFYSNDFYYGDMDRAYLLKKHWSTLFERSSVGECLVLGENNGKASRFYAGFLAPKTKFCLVVSDLDVISAKKSFTGFSEEQRMIKLNDFISLF